MLTGAPLTRLVNQWHAKKEELQRVKAEELALRVRLVAEGFDPTVRSGTQSLDLSDGSVLKAKKRLNYSFTSTMDLRRVLEKFKDVEPAGYMVADRIVRWSADLVVGEYHRLPLLDKGQDYKLLIDGVLIVKDATPELELQE